ncbi:MAG: DUF1624 domain-containing protein [Candidatus Lokiarchaeota archaeon]|nr:DUF1624 domain-containing protein [Candidatus Lokiarchaeota archaeon]
MIRLKSIDNFRGITIIAMIWLHLSDWWLLGDSQWFVNFSLLLVNYVFWVSFQFISGISTFLFYKTRSLKTETSEGNGKKNVKREFILRALLLLFVSLIYNTLIAIAISNPLYVWSLFILLSIAISLILIWPLLETSKWTRISLGIFFMIFNFISLSFLQDFEGQLNFFGVIYHILFYPISLHPIFSSFAAFLVGTAVGDILYDIYSNQEKGRHRKLLKKRIIIPSFIIGGILIVFVFSAELMQLLNLPSFYRIISSMGISLILFSVFILVEEYEILKTKKSFKFIFYYSFYSLTIYLVHNLLFFLFFGTLNLPVLLILLPLTIIIIGLLLKQLYERTRSNFALKVIMGKLAHRIAMRVEEKKAIKVFE